MQKRSQSVTQDQTNFDPSFEEALAGLDRIISSPELQQELLELGFLRRVSGDSTVTDTRTITREQLAAIAARVDEDYPFTREMYDSEREAIRRAWADRAALLDEVRRLWHEATR